ncbi:MAG TPA: 50S ribosomal protein L7ae [Epulopiscium sp.]|nr:50S ribosomal protein L7ae [Candidatus Epulonipiscium sp.]
MDKKIYGLIGICQKAGKLASGELACELAVKKNEAYLVILAQDASKNTNKKFNDKCTYRKVPLIKYGTKESLGNAIGKVARASIAVTDEKLAEKIAELIKQSTQ